MSFMLVSGKQFICESCEKVISVEYKDGAKMTQIGDFEIMRQQQIAQEFGEQQVINEKGFYLYDFGLCEPCYEKTVPETLRKRSTRINELLHNLDLLYRSAYGEIDEQFSKTLKQVGSNLTWNDISQAVGGIDEDELEDKRQHKGKRKSPLKTFMHSYAEELEHYIINQVLNIPRSGQIIKQYRDQSREILREMTKLLKSDNSLYLSKTSDASENLNDYIVTDTSVRVPIDGSVSKTFYYGMEINCRELIKNYRLDSSDFYLEKGALWPIVEKALERKV